MGIESWWSLFRQHSVDPVYVDLKKKVSGRRPVVAMDASIYIWLSLKNSKYIEELAVDFVLNYDISSYILRYFEDYRRGCVSKRPRLHNKHGISYIT